MSAPASAAGAPLRVLFFTSSLGGGGGEKQMVRVASHLGPGFAPSVAVARGGGSYEAELAPQIPLHALGARKIAAAWAPLRRLIARERPDLVCSFIDHANCVALAAAATLRGAPPVVAGVQTLPRRLLLPEATLRDRLLLRTMRTLYPSATRIVALSQGVRDELVELVRTPAERVEVIHNAGLDRDLEQRAAAPAEIPAQQRDGPVLVACGRLVPVKGFEFLLRALARVRERVPARLWIVGEGPLRGELEAEAERLGIRDAVWFAGFHDNPYPFMSAADVFVLSSVYEGFGNVIVEAMAVGTAVVAADCPYGPAEIVTDGRNGVLVPPRDPEALATGILRVLEDPALRARLAAGGSVRARDFAAPAIAAAYGRVFREVADGRAKAAA